ncbi:MAG: hypothetical protein KGZ42_01220 [Melioribacter sp.]|nr:hypothetical protein [Melioribacter sp.]
MKLKEDKINYKRNFEAALILSLVIIIVLFVLTPDIENKSDNIPYFPEPVITAVDIPNTNQSSPNNLRPPLPEIPSLIIPIDEPEILSDVIIKENIQSFEKSDQGNKSNTLKGNSKGVYEASSFPFVPRQIVEVVPEKVDGSEGAIKLKLLIGKDGFVLKHEVLNNTTNNSKCLTFVVNAVYKSRWQPIAFDGERVDYWLEKTYVFN